MESNELEAQAKETKETDRENRVISVRPFIVNGEKTFTVTGSDSLALQAAAKMLLS